MKIEIEVNEFEDILRGAYPALHRKFVVNENAFNIGFAEFQKGEKAGAEQVINYLRSKISSEALPGFENSLGCEHGREGWSCKECLK